MATAIDPLTPSEMALADEIGLARREHRPIVGRRGDLDLEAAYRIQRERFADAAIVGAKIDVAGEVLMHGPVTAEMLLDEPAVDLRPLVQPRLAPELAVLLSADVPADARPGDVARAIPGLFLAVDILASAWEAHRCDAPEAVADGASGGAFLLGEQVLTLDSAGALRLRVNGDIVGAGSIADLGDPVTRIAWLAAEVGGLRSGDVVFLGSPAESAAATTGTLLLEGPRGATLVAELGGAA